MAAAAAATVGRTTNQCPSDDDMESGSENVSNTTFPSSREFEARE